MHIEEIDIKGLNHKYKITIPSQTIEKKIETKLNSLAKNVKVSGFRPGKVPMLIVKQRYEEAARQEILEDSIHKGTHELFAQKKIRQANRPKVDLLDHKPGGDLAYTVEVEVMPEIDLKDHSKISLNKLVPEAADKDVKNSLEEIAAKHVRYEKPKKDRAAKEGDQVKIKLTLLSDGKPQDKYKNLELSVVLGEKFFVPGIEEALKGKKVSDEFETKISFDEIFRLNDVEEKNLSAKVAVIDVLEKKIFKIDDELAKEFQFENVEQLTNAVKEKVEQTAKNMCDLYIKRKLFDALSDMYDFDVPASMLEAEYKQIWASFKNQIANAKKNGEEVDDVNVDENDENLKEQYQTLALRRVRLALVISKLAGDNNIDITEDEARNKILEEASKYPGQEEAVINYYVNNPEKFQPLAQGIIEDKVVNFLTTQIKLTEKKVSSADIEKLMEEIFPNQDQQIENKSTKTSKAKKPATSKKDKEV